jgi:hypothetical protein
MTALFGGAASTVSALGSPAAPLAQPTRAKSGTRAAPEEVSALIAGAARDLSDYQQLTATGKLGEAGQKLESLKRKLEELQRSRP